MQKHNILYLENSSGFGGSSSNLYHILKKLDKTKYNPIVLIHNEGPNFEKIEQLGIKIIKVLFKDANKTYTCGKLTFLCIFFPVIWPLIMKFKTILRTENIALVHINTNLFMGIPMVIAARLTHTPIICYIRQSRPLIARERMFARFIDLFLVLNKKAADIYQRDIPVEKIRVLYDGIDVEEFGDISIGRLRTQYNLNSTKVVGLIGRIVKGKGHIEFVQAAKQVCAKQNNIRFVVIGDVKGGEKDYYQSVLSLVEQENLTDRVFFTGWREDIKEMMADLDILVLPSTTFPEGLPNTIIEAMALRKPVIASDIPGPSEIVEDGKTGFLVPPGKVTALTEKIVYLCNNPNIADMMGTNGRKRAEEFFNIRTVVATLDGIYRDIPQRG